MTAEEIRDVWQSLCLLRQALDDLLLAGGFDEEQIDWLQFLALAAGTLEKVIKLSINSFTPIRNEWPGPGDDRDCESVDGWPGGARLRTGLLAWPYSCR